jgi:hypothetical protein
VTAAGERQVLDWRDSEHWSFASGPCVYCGESTHLLDDQGRFAHKVCAEGRP